MTNAVERLREQAENWWDGETPPRYYSYLPTTGEFVESGNCDPSQPEPGVWLIPGSSTLSPVPSSCPAGCTLVYNDEVRSWTPIADRRGEVVYVDGEFRAIADLGKHPELFIKVHDAQYIMPDNDDIVGKIRMWINDDVIEFYDDPNLIQRKVLAAWEAKGETIRPVEDLPDYDDKQLTEAEDNIAAAEREAAREETSHAE